MKLVAVPLISGDAAQDVATEWARDFGLVRKHNPGLPMLSSADRWPCRDTIYFAQPERGGPIKIGWSVDPIRRVRQLRSWEWFPYVPRVVVANQSFVREWFLHQDLQRFRQREGVIGGEYYRPDSPVAELMLRLRLAAEACVSERYRVPDTSRSQARHEARQARIARTEAA